jgi:hypothetical protein
MVIALFKKHVYNNPLLHTTLRNNRTKGSHPALWQRVLYFARVCVQEPTQNKNPYLRAIAH